MKIQCSRINDRWSKRIYDWQQEEDDPGSYEWMPYKKHGQSGLHEDDRREVRRNVERQAIGGETLIKQKCDNRNIKIFNYGLKV